MEQTKIFAEFTWDNYRNDGDQPLIAEVKDISDAIEQGVKNGAAFFRTFEVTSMVSNGKKFSSEAENFSGNRYLGMSKIYTRDEVGAISKSYQDHIKHDPTDAQYVKLPYGRIVKLEANDMAYDSKGQKLWPKATAPKKAPSPPKP